ncbi:MAG: LysR family transcriptional regulator, partial [Saprospiraceae bacterium]|nr:LysR family transcriptional regulator [Saprospiraceae bacterium]
YLSQEFAGLHQQWQKIQRNIELIGRGEEGELRIGFVGSAMQAVIASALVRLNRSHPGIHTNLQEITNQAQIESVLRQKLDAGFIRTEHLPAGIASKMVLEENFCLVLPEDHWTTADKFRALSELKNEKFIFFGTRYSPDYYDLIWSIFSDEGFAPEISHRSVHAATIYKLVESHLGIAIVPKSLTHGFDFGVKFIELDQIRQKTRLYLIWKMENRDELLDNFIKLF